MFFLKRISILFFGNFKDIAMEILTLSAFKRRRGEGGGGRGLSGVWQLIQLSHCSLPMKYCLDVLRSCSVRFIFYTLHTFCSKKDC